LQLSYSSGPVVSDQLAVEEVDGLQQPTVHRYRSDSLVAYKRRAAVVNVAAIDFQVYEVLAVGKVAERGISKVDTASHLDSFETASGVADDAKKTVV
jgi:hypothetical protein